MTDATVVSGAIGALALIVLISALTEFDLRFWFTERDVILAALEHDIRRHAMQHGLEVTAVRLLDVRTPFRDDNMPYAEFGHDSRRADRPLIA